MDGIYEISINTPMGNLSGKVILKANGENLEGILEIMGMKNTLTGGKQQGNQCYFKGDIKNNALNQLKKYTWGKTAKIIYEVYRNVCQYN